MEVLVGVSVGVADGDGVEVVEVSLGEVVGVLLGVLEEDVWELGIEVEVDEDGGSVEVVVVTPEAEPVFAFDVPFVEASTALFPPSRRPKKLASNQLA